ncbi:MAG: 6-phosphogluconolactonase [Victivallales bacterium]|nr:6-phosphogluconolactonase [Victivallales bacterium]
MKVNNVMKFESPAEMSVAALSAMASYCLTTIRAKGRINIAVSGGSSPLGLFALLAKPANMALLPWSKVHLFWVDERFVPMDDEDNNFKVACDTFIRRSRIPEENIHCINTAYSSPAQAAMAYRSELESYFGPGIPCFDLILLGMGADGHTASLFPMAKSLQEKTLPVIDVPPPVSSEPKLPRITMTLPVINKAAKVFIIIAGAEKQHVVDFVLSHGSREIKYPLQLIENENLSWYISRQ